MLGGRRERVLKVMNGVVRGSVPFVNDYSCGNSLQLVSLLLCLLFGRSVRVCRGGGGRSCISFLVLQYIEGLNVAIKLY